MPRLIQFAVTLKDTQWTIFRDGQVVAQGMSRSRALEEAERLAHAEMEAGAEVELLIQDYIGKLSTRSTLG
jgi:hypothetical protein